MPLQATSGAASYDAFGGGVAAVPNYIEDVFSTYLYTGNGSTQTITNGIDLAGEGGLVWVKSRSNSTNHKLLDSGIAYSSTNWDQSLTSNSTAAASYYATGAITAQATGFEITSPDNAAINESAKTYVSWTFRKQPKFFDVVTYTGTGSARTVAHNLGSTPGCIIVKRTDDVNSWVVYHRGVDATSPQNYALFLDLTNARATNSIYWNNTAPTSTNFTVGTSGGTNLNGATYVAYVFAHDAGGFGLTGTDNVISCGSFTTDVSGIASVNLGYEPQWLMFKRTDTAGYGWFIYDSMRGFVNSGSVSTADDSELRANTSAAETTQAGGIPNATGFDAYTGLANATYIYIAIRRGPMKVPTSGTSVYNADFYNGSNSPPSWNSGFVTDLGIYKDRTGGASNTYDRLRGAFQLQMNSSGLESASTIGKFDYMNGFGNSSGTVDTTLLAWMFRRAPSVLDVVCYTGTDSNASVPHNLQAVPQLAIIKRRNGTSGWVVGCPLLSNTAYGLLNETIFFYTSGGNPNFQNTAWSDQYLYLGTDQDVNGSGYNYVAYLFATCAGVSKVGSYTGNDDVQTINCGFTGGARFVMIKRTDSSEDWFVFDTARGISSGDDKILSLNTTAAEVTNRNNVSPASVGFEVNNDGGYCNASGGTYIYLAIA